jgi:glycosyltransferase involved in cell wall biosynthesis
VGDVIAALSQLPENVKFVICGVGELEEKLKSNVKKLNLESRVTFLGFVPHDELPKLLKASDIFIRPSLSEGMGNSFIEAMAAGLPTIGTPVGGIVDFLEEGKTGYLCQPENPKSIAETVERVISDQNKNIILETAKKLVIEKYDWNKIALEMKEVFENM